MELDKADTSMKTCRFPVECADRLRVKNVDADVSNLRSLALFCSMHVPPRSAPWKFVDFVSIPVPEGIDAKQMERRLATWGMDPSPDWSWLPTLSRPSAAGRSGTDGLLWRTEQLDLRDKARALRPGHIGLVEGSTGIGKTRVFAELAHELSTAERVVIAVPTVLVGQQWQDTWRDLGHAPMAEAWGRARYGADEFAGERQAAALEASRSAPVTLCSHHLLPKLFSATGRVATLFVDESHFLDKAVMSVSGSFMPLAAFGPWLTRWYERSGFAIGEVGEVELGGRLLSAVVAKMAPAGMDGSDDDWRASIVCDEGAQPLVWLRHGRSAQHALEELWQNVGRAWLFSGTLGVSGADGQRSTLQISRRLQIPMERRQDLGRVRAAWRDQNVCVRLPEGGVAGDGKQWLGAYRDRKPTWWAEVAHELGRQDASLKTLVLLNSYEDILGIHALLTNPGDFVASDRETSFEVSRDTFIDGHAWCWLATGSAWTGMDLLGKVSRVVVASLPLPDPQSLQLVAKVEDAVFDAVSRFKQGLGRLVRAAEGGPREIVVLDGRINDRTRTWRRICQPFLQVLGEEFELHERFSREAGDLVISGK